MDEGIQKLEIVFSNAGHLSCAAVLIQTWCVKTSKINTQNGEFFTPYKIKILCFVSFKKIDSFLNPSPLKQYIQKFGGGGRGGERDLFPSRRVF